MTAKSMDVFSLRDTVVGEYRKFATSFTTIHAEDIRQQVEAIYAQGRFWPEPLIQINPSYKRGANLANLIASGALEQGTANIRTSSVLTGRRSRFTSIRSRQLRSRRTGRATSSRQAPARVSRSASLFRS